MYHREVGTASRLLRSLSKRFPSCSVETKRSHDKPNAKRFSIDRQLAVPVCLLFDLSRNLATSSFGNPSQSLNRSLVTQCNRAPIEPNLGSSLRRCQQQILHRYRIVLDVANWHAAPDSGCSSGRPAYAVTGSAEASESDFDRTIASALG